MYIYIYIYIYIYELNQAGELLLRLRTLLSSLPPTFNVYGSECIQEPSPMHNQYVRNMQ